MPGPTRASSARRVRATIASLCELMVDPLLTDVERQQARALADLLDAEQQIRDKLRFTPAMAQP